MVVTQFGSMFKHPSFIHVKGGGHQLLGCCCFSLQRQIPSWWCWGVCFSPYLQRNVEHDYWPRVLQVQAFLHQHHWPVSCKSWTKNPYITSLSLVKAFTNSFLDPVEMVRSNFLLMKNPRQRPKFSPFTPRPMLSLSQRGGKSRNTQGFTNSYLEDDECWVELATQRVRPWHRHKRSWFSSFPDNFHCLSLLEFVGGLDQQ